MSTTNATENTKLLPENFLVSEDASLNRTIVNPIFKDSASFLKRSGETGGEYCECEVTLLPGGKNVPHIHKKYQETFTALEGDLGVKAGGKTLILKPGETFTVPIGTAHYFFNPGPGTIRFKIVIAPGFEGFEYMLRILYGLARDGQTDKNGLPKSLSQLALVGEIGDTSAAGIFVLLAPLLKLLAARARKRGEEKKLMELYCAGL